MGPAHQRAVRTVRNLRAIGTTGTINSEDVTIMFRRFASLGRRGRAAAAHAGQGAGRATSAAFWAWIAYQTIKGLITTTLVWAPLAYYYFFA